MPYVFIFYVRENTNLVEQLHQALKAACVQVWLDRNDIAPGIRFKTAIRRAIQSGNFYIACFSAEYNARDRTYMNTELTLAIDELSQRPHDRVWFIPVKLNDCEIPDRDIGGGETLRDLNYVELYRDWDRGVQRILSVIQPERSRTLSLGFDGQFRRVFYEGFDREHLEPGFLQQRFGKIWLEGKNGFGEGRIAEGVYTLCNTKGIDAALTNRIDYYEPGDERVDQANCKVSVKVRIEPPTRPTVGRFSCFVPREDSLITMLSFSILGATCHLRGATLRAWMKNTYDSCWVGRYRRLSKDYETQISSSDAMFTLAMIRTLLSRL